MKKEFLEKIRLVAKLRKPVPELVFLIQEGDQWAWIQNDQTILKGKSLGEMVERGRRHFAAFPFELIDFGVLYTLPERDEVGQYALFHQARNSYKVSNGIVFDPLIGYSYKVDFISLEGKKIIADLEAYAKS